MQHDGGTRRENPRRRRATNGFAAAAILAVAVGPGCARVDYDLTLLKSDGGRTPDGSTQSTSAEIDADAAAPVDASLTATGNSPSNAVTAAQTPQDSGTIPDSGTPASTAAAICSFGTPELLGDPNSPGNEVWSPTLSADGLTLYLGVIVLGLDEQIGVSTRPDRNLTFGQAATLPPPLTEGISGTPHLIANGLSLYFFSIRAGGLGDRDLYRATRPTTGDDFDTVTALTELNSTSLEHGPWVSSDELRAFFVTERITGDEDIWQASRTSSSLPFDTPALVVELSSPQADGRMTLSPDELVIIYASQRTGTQGSYDLYRATRPTTNAPFSPPVALTNLNTEFRDMDPALTPDGQELFFTSDRNGEIALYRSIRTCN